MIPVVMVVIMVTMTNEACYVCCRQCEGVDLVEAIRHEMMINSVDHFD